MQAALEQVKKYREGLAPKTEALRKEVARQIAEAADIGFNGAGYDDVISRGMVVPDVDVTQEDRDNSSVVIAHGKEAVFAEFGAGAYYNGPAGSSPHPWGPANVFYIGTYGYGHGARNVWGYYDEGGKLHLTHGTPASMPMYNATQEARSNLTKTAREIFSKEDVTNE